MMIEIKISPEEFHAQRYVDQRIRTCKRDSLAFTVVT
jgi:hypothetical protein